MKHLNWTNVIWVALLCMFGACTEDESGGGLKVAVDPTVISSILEAQAEFDDAFFVSNQAVGVSGGRSSDELCAQIALDSTNRNLVLDFGEGCTGPAGITRSGKLIVNYLSFSFEDGISYGLSFEDFSVNGNVLNGSLQVNGFQRNDQNQLFFQVEIDGGRVDLSDGRSLTHSSIRTFTWVEGENEEEKNRFEFTGSAQGLTLDNIEYAISFTNPLILDSSCFDEGFAFASAGVLSINLSSLEGEVLVDFGNGSCDAIANWTYLDQSGTLNLRD